MHISQVTEGHLSDVRFPQHPIVIHPQCIGSIPHTTSVGTCMYVCMYVRMYVTHMYCVCVRACHDSDLQCMFFPKDGRPGLVTARKKKKTVNVIKLNKQIH